MGTENINQEYTRRFLLIFFELKVKIATLNSEIMTKQLENYIKNYAESTAENFAKDLKKYLPNEESITGETIRNIIKKVKENKNNKTFLISTERTSIFLNLLNIIADNTIKDKNDYGLKNKLLIDFYKCPDESVLESYIKDNSLYESYTADSLLEYIITKHDEISNKICKKHEPLIISKQLNVTGKILKKYEWNIRYSDNLFKQQSIVNDPDFDEIFLPKDINKILTDIDDTIIDFMSKHIRYLRLISRHSKISSFANILGIKENSLIQYETKQHEYKLNDSQIFYIVDYFAKEHDKNFRQLFDWFFVEITWPTFKTDNELRKKFTELIDDYTFLRYTKFQHDNPEKETESSNKTEKRIETTKKTGKTYIRQETIDSLENEIRFFVLQTLCGRTGVEIKTYLDEIQEYLKKLSEGLISSSEGLSIFSKIL